MLAGSAGGNPPVRTDVIYFAVDSPSARTVTSPWRLAPCASSPGSGPGPCRLGQSD
jgi:hypothetical protein